MISPFVVPAPLVNLTRSFIYLIHRFASRTLHASPFRTSAVYFIILSHRTRAAKTVKLVLSSGDLRDSDCTCANARNVRHEARRGEARLGKKIENGRIYTVGVITNYSVPRSTELFIMRIVNPTRRRSAHGAARRGEARRNVRAHLGLMATQRPPPSSGKALEGRGQSGTDRASARLTVQR